MKVDKGMKNKLQVCSEYGKETGKSEPGLVLCSLTLLIVVMIDTIMYKLGKEVKEKQI